MPVFIGITKWNLTAVLIISCRTSDPFQSGKITSVTLLKLPLISKIAPKGNLLGLSFRKGGFAEVLCIAFRFSALLASDACTIRVYLNIMKLERSSVATPVYTFPLDDKYLIHALVS